MTDPDWGEARGEGSPSRRRVPAWVWWGCGGGCLLCTLVLAAIAVFATRLYREGSDPEKQWPRLGEVLAFDERPAGLELEFGLDVWADQFHLIDPARRLLATIVQYPESAGAERDQLLDPQFELPMGLGSVVDPESGSLDVQGRAVPCLRFTRIEPEPPEGHGPGIRVDLTGTRAKWRTLELRRLEGAKRIEDAEVAAFLAPFDVWRER
jgi:hypothetical protein